MADKDHSKLLKLARDRFDIAVESDKSERLLCDTDTRFALNYEGCQWPRDIRDQRQATTGTDNQNIPARPCLVLNKIPEKIDQADGEFKQMRPTVKIRGVDSKSDPKMAEIYGGLIRGIEYDSNARTAYNTSHTSVLYGGRGAWRVDIEDDPDDPFIKILRINRIPNVLSVYGDPFFTKQDRSDQKYKFVTSLLSEEEFKVKYPDAPLEDWDSKSSEQKNWRTEKKVRIAEYWYAEEQDKTFYRVSRPDETGAPTETTVTELNEGENATGEKKIKVPVIRHCLMIHNHVLDGPHDWPGQFIPIIMEFGKEVWVGERVTTRGMVRFAIDPQMMYNYWSSLTTEEIALIPKSPYMATPKMIGNHVNEWNTANVRNYMYLLFDADPNMPGMGPKREAPPMLSTAIAQELARMEHDIMSAMGIYAASLGDEGQEKSGKAITARQRQGSIGGYSYTDGFEIAYTHSTRVVIDLIPHVYDTERVAKILGDDDSEKQVPINARPDSPLMQGVDEPTAKEFIVPPKQGVSEYVNDLSIGRYDLVATMGPSYTTQREEALAMMVDFMDIIAKANPAAVMSIIDLVGKNLDIPFADELNKRLKKLVPPGMRELEPDEQPPPEPPPDPVQVAKVAEAESKAEKAKHDAEKARLEVEEAKVDLTSDVDKIKQIIMDVLSTQGGGEMIIPPQGGEGIVPDEVAGPGTDNEMIIEPGGG